MQMNYVVNANIGNLTMTELRSLKPHWQTEGSKRPSSITSVNMWRFESVLSTETVIFTKRLWTICKELNIPLAPLDVEELVRGITEAQFKGFKTQLDLKPTTNYMFRCWWVGDGEPEQFEDLENENSSYEIELRKELPPEIVDQLIAMAREDDDRHGDPRIRELLEKWITCSQLFKPHPCLWCDLQFVDSWAEFKEQYS